MRLIDDSHYEGFFVREFDSNLLLLICKTFDEQVLTNDAFNNSTEQEFIIMLLSCIFQSPSFSFTLDFLEENELNNIKEMVD